MSEIFFLTTAVLSTCVVAIYKTQTSTPYIYILFILLCLFLCLLQTCFQRLHVFQLCLCYFFGSLVNNSKSQCAAQTNSQKQTEVNGLMCSSLSCFPKLTAGTSLCVNAHIYCIYFHYLYLSFEANKQQTVF